MNMTPRPKRPVFAASWPVARVALRLVRLLAGISVAGLAQAGGLTLLTENTPPTNMLENGKMIGPNTDKMRELMQRAKQTYTLETLPWKRAYLMAGQQADTCIYPTTRTPEREGQFQWIGPIMSIEWMLYARIEYAPPLKTVDDARPFLIGTYFGDARDDFFRAGGFRVASVTDDALNPKKLLVGRIDLWAASDVRGKQLIRQNGWNDKIVPVLGFKKVDLYLACNLQTAPELVKRLNLIVGDMKADGTFKAIEGRY